MKEKENFGIRVFWIIIIFYLDPGGYLNSVLSPLAGTLFSFGCLFLSYAIFIFNYRNSRINIFKLRYFNGYIFFIIIWAIYFFVVYYGFNNNDGFPGIAKTILRNPNIFFKSLIVFPLAYFSMFSLNTFMKILIYSTIAIGFLFVVTVFTGLPLMDTWNADRNLGGAKRNFMNGYGLIYFVIPIALSIIFFKFKLNKKILLAFILVLCTIMITVWRRDIFGVFEFIVIVSIMVNYVQNKFILNSFTKYLNFKNIIAASIVFITLSLFASNFLESTNKIILGTLGSIGIIENTESVSNTDSRRMSFTAQVGIVNAIKDNFLIGTGFDPIWMTGDGGDKKWEGSDYIFLASFAMYGIIGLLLFLPFYFISFSIIKNFLNLIRSNFRLIVRYKKYLGIPMIVGIAAGAEILKNVVEYPNWFYPIGAINNNSKYFIFFGLLLGSYFNILFRIKKIKSFQWKEK